MLQQTAVLRYPLAGAERSVRIDASKMDVSNLKLVALASIVRELMKKNPPGYGWSGEARALPDKLMVDRIDNLDNLIRVSSIGKLS